MKVTPPILPPFFLKSAGRDRKLIGAGAEDDLERGAAVYAVGELVRIRGVSQLRHARRGGQSVLAALCVVGNPASAVITRSEERRVGKECRARWLQDHKASV